LKYIFEDDGNDMNIELHATDAEVEISSGDDEDENATSTFKGSVLERIMSIGS
jgi:hypothetical protein